MSDTLFEVNFDTLCGPTHHFGGLSWGNIASTTNESAISSPKKAALEGLEKMKLVYTLGGIQAILPPHPRPDFETLRLCGFSGSDQDIAMRCFTERPHLLMACSSSSFMWAANSATVTASSDSYDKKVHITPANLISNLHRSIETKTTEHVLHQVFHDQKHFTVHPPLPSSADFFDEGAANQTRFSFGGKGLYLFVYGDPQDAKKRSARKYPARQTKASFDILVRQHRLADAQVVYAQQLPEAIDEGVFHNDVISCGHENIFIIHERAFLYQKKVLDELQKKARSLFKKDIRILPITNQELTLKNAVRSYLFNSQLLTVDGKRILLAPNECKNIAQASTILKHLHNSGVISKVFFIELSESMKNGGGPACLRLRAPLKESEIASLHQGVLFQNKLFDDLSEVIDSYYPDSLTINQLADAHFRRRCDLAVSKIYKILKLS